MHLRHPKLTIRFLLVLCLTLILMVLSANCYIERKVVVSFDAETDKNNFYQVFYTQNEGEQFTPAQSVTQTAPAGKTHVSILLPIRHLYRLRLDVGRAPGQVRISSLVLQGESTLEMRDFNKFHLLNIDERQMQDNQLIINSKQHNPFIVPIAPIMLSHFSGINFGYAVIFAVIYFVLSYKIVQYLSRILEQWQQSRRDTVSQNGIKPPGEMKPLATTVSTKDRIVAVDLVRLLAAFAILFSHLRSLPQMTDPIALGIVKWTGLFGSVDSLFFILSGFFVCRNITWKKALNNAWWCFLALALWNFITWGSRYMVVGQAMPFYKCFGISSFFLPCIPFVESFPLSNAPLWFMRDLVFLFLISPILAKYARYIFPSLLFLSAVPQLSVNFMHMGDIHQVCMRPYALAYFCFGCFLAGFSAETRQKILSYYSTKCIAVYLIVVGVFCYYLHWELYPLLRGLFGMWMLYQVARWMEVHIPGARSFALRFAPIMFLTFAAHVSIYFTYIPLIIKATGWQPNSWATLTYPFIAFGLCAAIFFSMKRWCRPLMHLVCYYKLRPDDLKSAQNAKSKA